MCTSSPCREFRFIPLLWVDCFRDTVRKLHALHYTLYLFPFFRPDLKNRLGCVDWHFGIEITTFIIGLFKKNFIADPPIRIAACRPNTGLCCAAGWSAL
jgi:hypothetical protein